ncbi:MAG TPA: lipopolysaccharide kinase InaA family protein [Syntrophorhabdaceae bacterium]|jgi:hypothetical protein
MNLLTPLIYGHYLIYFAGEPADPLPMIQCIGRGELIEGKGRGGIALVRLNGQMLACRKYTHGGLLRAVTRDIFFSDRRALSELGITGYLRDNGFPVVVPFAVIAEKKLLTKRLYILTVYMEGAVDLLQFLVSSSKMRRLRTIKRFAELLYKMEKLGVRHPDLHLNNVLVTRDRQLVFLDFDKCGRGIFTGRDTIRMIFRLNRHAEKMEKKGAAAFTQQERAMFLRAYHRISGRDLYPEMERKAGSKKLLSRVGWLVERLLYGW